MLGRSLAHSRHHFQLRRNRRLTRSSHWWLQEFYKTFLRMLKHSVPFPVTKGTILSTVAGAFLFQHDCVSVHKARSAGIWWGWTWLAKTKSSPQPAWAPFRMNSSGDWKPGCLCFFLTSCIDIWTSDTCSTFTRQFVRSTLAFYSCSC